MKIDVCTGNVCNTKGSAQVREQLRALINENDLDAAVSMKDVGCMKSCGKAVCVTIDGNLYSVSPETAGLFFKDHVMGRAIG
ncbi:MAG: NAD(P)H-dependent oxidoreductase subunit E [Oscillospiraceae bacterium]|jgi:NADH:ubiquinone oxidoreductase subunit E|nr:NAD(P)H-dependent oxidoreductase subunit E [Oscillospiraceae bacterium]